MEIIARSLAQEQLLDIREAVVGSGGIQCEGARLLARLPHQDGDGGLELGAADDIGQERRE